MVFFKHMTPNSDFLTFQSDSKPVELEDKAGLDPGIINDQVRGRA